jgi:hypothetical protein
MTIDAFNCNNIVRIAINFKGPQGKGLGIFYAEERTAE